MQASTFLRIHLSYASIPSQTIKARGWTLYGDFAGGKVWQNRDLNPWPSNLVVLQQNCNFQKFFFFDPTELIINGHRVPHDGLRPIFSKAIKKGVFNLLYTFLTLRPCFGCFNPELVETFENEKFAELTVDSNFVGSSQSGRTYAGCVRSKRCNVLADSRVSDTCLNCSNLRNIAINRSVLTSPGKSPWPLTCPEIKSFRIKPRLKPGSFNYVG